MHNPMIGRVTSEYDLRRKHPVFGTIQPHRGIDLGAPIGITPWDYLGAPIKAAYAGVVEQVCTVWNSGWGAIWGRSGCGVFVRNPDGEGQYYGHMRDVFVKKGQKVTEGQIIGGMGVSGNVTGPHLHFEIHNRDSGPSNNYTRTRNPRLDFDAAGITPGVEPVEYIQHSNATPVTVAQEATLSAEEVKQINDHTTAEVDRLLNALQWAPMGYDGATLKKVLHEARTGAQQGYQRIVGVDSGQAALTAAIAQATANGVTPEQITAIAEQAREGAKQGVGEAIREGLTEDYALEVTATVKNKEN